MGAARPAFVRAPVVGPCWSRCYRPPLCLGPHAFLNRGGGGRGRAGVPGVHGQPVQGGGEDAHHGREPRRVLRDAGAQRGWQDHHHQHARCAPPGTRGEGIGGWSRDMAEWGWKRPGHLVSSRLVSGGFGLCARAIPADPLIRWTYRMKPDRIGVCARSRRSSPTLRSARTCGIAISDARLERPRACPSPPSATRSGDAVGFAQAASGMALDFRKQESNKRRPSVTV